MTDHLERAGVNRREALRTMASGVGAAAASALWVTELGALAEQRATLTRLTLASAPQAAAAWTPKVLVGPWLETVATMVELIIPTTDTPGARAALVDRFIDGTLDAATPAVRGRFLSGLGWLAGRCNVLFQRSFVEATTAQQIDLLTRLSQSGSGESAEGVEFFTAIKNMTIAGYYSTEIGLRQELGDSGQLMLARFEGCTHPEHQ
jgi:Gluconate 2-dehydrogenase subunit 3